MGSDNLGGVPRSEEPDNQQERLITVGWVIGFVDGEGCFSIGFTRQPDRANRKGYRTGYQVNHDFVVPQGARSLEALNALQSFFGVGRVYVNTRHDNHREEYARVHSPSALGPDGRDHSILPSLCIAYFEEI